MDGRQLSEELVAAIVSDYADGMICRTIARKHSVSLATTSRLALRHGLRRLRVLTKDQRNEISVAYASGEKIAAIAADYRVHPHTIVAVARKAGIAPRPAGRIRRNKHG